MANRLRLVPFAFLAGVGVTNLYFEGNQLLAVNPFQEVNPSSSGFAALDKLVQDNTTSRPDDEMTIIADANEVDEPRPDHHQAAANNLRGASSRGDSGGQNLSLSTSNQDRLPTSQQGLPPTDELCVEWSSHVAKDAPGNLSWIDEWWTHHPTWVVDVENETHVCWKHELTPKLAFFGQVYANQFHDPTNRCSEASHRFMWSSGWGADFSNVAMGLLKATGQRKRPLHIQFNPEASPWWHYAANKDGGTNPTCPSKDMTCYFLPLHGCKEDQLNPEAEEDVHEDDHEFEQRLADWAYEYATRPQMWFRRAIFDYLQSSKAPRVPPGSSVLHVRRADVLLHGEFSRKYFSIEDYLNKLPEEKRKAGSHILLLTDDQNAIDEAKEFFPDIKWHYFRRKRFRGTQGGWENQIPSKSPLQESIVILATMKLVRESCTSLVHGTSNFSDLLWQAMQLSGNDEVEKYLVDEGDEQLYQDKNALTLLSLHSRLNRRRRERGEEEQPLDPNLFLEVRKTKDGYSLRFHKDEEPISLSLEEIKKADVEELVKNAAGVSSR